MLKPYHQYGHAGATAYPSADDKEANRSRYAVPTATRVCWF